MRDRRIPCGALVALTVVFSACTSAGSGEDADPTPDRVTMGAASVVANDNSPLSAWIQVSTEEPAVVSAELVSGDHRVEVPPTEPGTDHELAVVGMRPDRTYTATLTALPPDPTTSGSDSGAAATTTVEVVAGPLPPDAPPLAVESDPDSVQPGVILLNVGRLGSFPEEGQEPPPPVAHDRESFALALDEAGEVVWYYDSTQTIDQVSMTTEGTVLMLFRAGGGREVDLMGRTVREYVTDRVAERSTDGFGRPLVGDDPELVVPVEVHQFHHELTDLGDGRIVTLVPELVEVDGFTSPQCEEDPATFEGRYQLVSDEIVIFDRATGAVEDRWALADMVDPRELPGWAFCEAVVPDPFFPEAPDAGDWSHANAVLVDESTNEVVVSIRHLDMLLAFRYRADEAGPSGEVLWSTGPSGTAALVGADPSAWTYGQHAPEWEDDGSLLVYDNGNNRPEPLDGPAPPGPASRAVRYDIDRSGSVPEFSLAWEWVTPDDDGNPVFGPFVGDADLLANGNVLVAHGGRRQGRPWVVEAVPEGTDAAEVVWRLAVDDDDQNWFVYRASKVPPLAMP